MLKVNAVALDYRRGLKKEAVPHKNYFLFETMCFGAIERF